MPGRQESVAPVRFAVRGLAPHVRQGNIRRQIFVRTPQGIAGPGPRAGETLGDVAGVHEDAARAVRVGPGSHRVDEGDAIRMCRHVRQQAGNHLAAFACRQKRPRTFHEIAVLALERDEVFGPRQRLAIPLLKFRLVLPQIHVRSGPRAEDLQDSTRFRREMGPSDTGLPDCVGRRLLGCRYFSAEQVRKPDARQGCVNIAEKASTREDVFSYGGDRVICGGSAHGGFLD